MAPPGLFKATKGLPSKNTHSKKTPKKSLADIHEVQEPSKTPSQPKEFLFSKFPPEIQYKIWAEALEKPACHTFKIHRSRSPGSWDIHVHAIPQRYDTSAYRRWQSLLHGGPNNNKFGKDAKIKDNDKLKNLSFQIGFRHAMVDFQRILLKISGDYQWAAAINAGTDLVIIEFERGQTAPTFSWFEHSTRNMDLAIIRHRMRNFKRVAIHYKSKHAPANKHGPFQCYCAPPMPLGCHKYKACCFELACFLDCFKNLKEFYFVVQAGDETEKAWAASYKKRVHEKRYLADIPNGGAFKLSHYFDTKNEYIQHCPPGLFGSLGLNVAASPIVRPGGPRDCLVKAAKIYRGIIDHEEFQNSQDQRDAVKFGLLIEYPREDKGCF
ncbi:hypothetical protein VM1G_02374 [Cytospora mali]|uniref:Uncharacterized protein n=1 Tax=Cytospora mali TaxID=578113 RepID=A0A194VPI6_CYTMA|nr:hypothetical protein VM1G_02374 [Valsa mali]